MSHPTTHLEGALVGVCCAYLILSTFLISTLGEGSIYDFGLDLTPQHTIVNISSSTNMSELGNIEIESGEWVLNSGKLVSTEPSSSFVIISEGDMLSPVITYRVSNVTDDFKLLICRDQRWVPPALIDYYILFDKDKNKAFLCSYTNFFYLIPMSNVYATAYPDLSSSSYNYRIIVNRTKDSIGAVIYHPADVKVLNLDTGVLLFNYHFKDLPLSRQYGGIWSKAIGFQVLVIDELDTISPTAVMGFFDTLEIMTKLIFWNMPEYNIPIWVNLLFIKLNFVIMVVVAIKLLRG